MIILSKNEVLKFADTRGHVIVCGPIEAGVPSTAEAVHTKQHRRPKRYTNGEVPVSLGTFWASCPRVAGSHGLAYRRG